MINTNEPVELEILPRKVWALQWTGGNMMKVEEFAQETYAARSPAGNPVIRTQDNNWVEVPLGSWLVWYEPEHKMVITSNVVIEMLSQRGSDNA